MKVPSDISLSSLKILTTLLIIPLTLNAKPTIQKSPISQIKASSALIDKTIEKDLAAKKLSPFPITNDATLLRRAYIGIIGRIPTHKETITFLNSKKKNKRSQLIETLTHSPGYESKTFNFWADLLRLKSTDQQYGIGWHVWLRKSVATNKPYNKMVYEMLSASGHATQNPAVGYYLRDRNMLLDNVSNSVKVFLGTQIGCAQCHDHPFEDWTQKQYYQLAAFGANIDYKSETARKKILETAIHITNSKIDPKLGKKQKRAKKRQLKRTVKQTKKALKPIFKRFKFNEISINQNKTLRLPENYEYNDGKPGDIVKPKPIFNNIPNLHQGPNKLENFAKWVTDPKNPQFTKTIANRLWQRAFGYGLAEQLDNWTDSTKVSHPETLALVEKILIKNNYNTRETMRILYHTKLFQRQVSIKETTRGRPHPFQGPILRRLSAEELHDSFLTLEKGNQDNNKNQTFASRWKKYSTAIQSILNASPQETVELAAFTKQNEKEINSLRAQARKLRLATQKATGDGLTEKAAELKKQQRALSKKIKSTQRKNLKKAAEKSTMAASMAQMATMNVLRSKRNKGPLRASEMPAPAKGGRFLNKFGASDRNTSNAAHTDASIPQTLTLLNGREIVAVTDRKGILPNLLRKAKTPTAKLNILFTTIYSRYPTKNEIKKFSPLMKSPKQTRVLAKAMLNSKTFLFLQ